MDDLDRVLLSDDTIAPSSGFTRGVMEAVEAATREPPPLPFPWGRYAVNVAACAAWAASCLWLADLLGPAILDEPFAELGTVEPDLTYVLAAAFAAIAVWLARSARARAAH